MLPNLGMGELLLIFMIVLLLFGGGKITKIAKDLGTGIREFKKSLNGEDEVTRDEKKSK